MNYAGVELGGTKCVAILARGINDVIAREFVPTGTAPDETLGRLETILRDWQRSQPFDALGVASFGPMDVDPGSPTYGTILATPKPGWSQTNLRRLADAVGVPTIFDTDVNGAALAEMNWGSGQGFQDFAYVTVGTGVGIGLMVDGKAPHGFSHCELGHIRVARSTGDDWPGACPFHGDCVEGLVSGSALRARFGERLDRLPPDHLVWEQVSSVLAQLCHAIVCAAAPRRIAIGGGVMQAQPHLLEKIRTKLIESLNGFLRVPGEHAYVCAPALGSDAGPVGAIALAMKADAS